MKTEGINHIIEVKECVFTEKAIKAVQSWQSSNNELLKFHEKLIADVICFILFNQDLLDEEEEVKKGIEYMKELSMLRQYLERMSKP